MKAVTWTLLLTVWALAVPAWAARLNDEGARQLSALPPAGVHPRVFFTAEDLPDIRARLESEGFGEAFRPVLQQVVNGVRSEWGPFAELDLSRPTEEQMNKYVISGEGRNITWGMAALYAVLYEDPGLRDLMCRVTENYARLLLASRERALEKQAAGDGGSLSKNLQFWLNDRYDVGVSWTVGASGYAVCYDVLYNHMTREQRDIVREAIALSTQGRRPYGSGMPIGFAASNHYGYHGDLAVLLCAIEGEPGFDEETFEVITQVLRDYWEVAFTGMGASHEDGYGPNVGLRGGGRGFMALARRGLNVFGTEKFRNFIDWLALEHEPFPNGVLIGGASGAHYTTLYPTSTVLVRYMYPERPTANFCYRHQFGDGFERGFRWQGRLDFMMFGGNWKGPESREAMLSSAGLDLTTYFPVRGKWMARSDWSEDALCLTLDARPDAWMIGHDKVDRGHFTVSALGRMWAFIGNFNHWNESRENSMVHIDGKAQAWKAPSARFVWQQDAGTTAAACVDLKYAYDWQWSPPWPKVDKVFPEGWEPERSSPVDLGWPKEHAPAWLPKELFGSDTGYSHRNGLHRRPYNPVRHAYRSALLRRGPHPYVLIADEVRKPDEDAHRFEWIMQVSKDLRMLKHEGRSVTLAGPDTAASTPARLLVHVIRAEDASARTPTEIPMKLEPFLAGEHKKSGTRHEGARLICTVESKDPHFRVLLYPYREGDALPEIESMGDRFSVSWPDRKDQYVMSPDAERGIRVRSR